MHDALDPRPPCRPASGYQAAVGCPLHPPPPLRPAPTSQQQPAAICGIRTSTTHPAGAHDGVGRVDALPDVVVNLGVRLNCTGTHKFEGEGRGVRRKSALRVLRLCFSSLRNSCPCEHSLCCAPQLHTPPKLPNPQPGTHWRRLGRALHSGTQPGRSAGPACAPSARPTCSQGGRRQGVSSCQQQAVRSS